LSKGRGAEQGQGQDREGSAGHLCLFGLLVSDFELVRDIGSE
jgi:hypothetical protein